MPREFSRTQRVAEEVQRILAEMLQREVSDPRLARITISAVEVSRDLAHAKIFVSCLDEAEEPAEVLRGLRHAAGFLRTGLAKRLNTRTVPELRFVHDTSISDGSRLSALIDRAVASDRLASEEEED